MVFPSDSSNYRVSYREGERVSKDEQVTPMVQPGNTPPAKDFKKILEREREKKNAISKGAKQDDDEEKQVTDRSTEEGSFDNDLSQVTSSHEKITSLPYDSKKGKKSSKVASDDVGSPTDSLEADVDVAILPSANVKVKAKNQSDTEVVIDPDLIKELTDKMTDSFGSQFETKSSTTAKAAKDGSIGKDTETDLSDGDDVIAVLPQPTINQPIQTNGSKQNQEGLSPDTKENVQTQISDELPVSFVPPKSETKVKTDQEIPSFIPLPQQAKPASETRNVESPFVLFAAYGRAQKDGANVQVNTDVAFVSAKDSSVSGKANVSSIYSEEDVDVRASVIPVGAPVSISANTGVSESRNTAPILTPEDIDSIVNQIEKLYTVSVQGKTDTVIVLKQPPLFDGAHVVIKSSANAPNEFNLSFENLNQTAQKLIDSNANQARLSAALDEKGFTVHIITATTLIETFNVKSSESQGGKPNDQQGNRGEDGQPDQRQNKKKQG